MNVPPEVQKLVDKFESQKRFYTEEANEQQARQDLLDPLFKALGWDMQNDELQREVRYEKLIVSGAPDYGFYHEGQIKFYLEAKAPHVDIATHTKSIQQLRRYGWSKKLGLSVLSDFEEILIYDVRFRPKVSDKPKTALYKKYHYTQFVEKWEEISALLSRAAVRGGSLEAATKAKKRGTQPVDEAFLEELRGWRLVLAKDIARRNPRLSIDDLNRVTQLIIDRLVFLRICEDRGIEAHGRLRDLVLYDDVWDRMLGLFRESDERYDSGLFYFGGREKITEAPDTISPSLKVGTEALRQIISSVYEPSPYEFSVFPPDILGQVYEQFLGEVIRFTDGHQVRIEEKPEVRQAGGVYYTPTYIVDFVLAATLEGLLGNKEPEEVAQLAVIDPACGSGAFLIGAYQYLIDWHRDRYVDQGVERHLKGKNPTLKQLPDGSYTLTVSEKRRILVNNIYGIDIDRQAVEVTKLSLALKTLEGETEQPTFFEQERVLPDLGNNIKCGNSLIASDFSNDPTELVRVHAFDWEVQFPVVAQRGGFDAVIGNPPWGADMEPSTRKYLSEKFARVVQRMVDSYIYFTDQSLRLARSDGRVGLVLPATVLNQVDAGPLRKLLLGVGVTAAINLGKDIFTKKVLNTTAILIVGGKQPAQMSVKDLSALPLSDRGEALTSVGLVGSAEWLEQVKSDVTNTFVTRVDGRTALLMRLRKTHGVLSDFLVGGISRGVSPDIAEAHVISDRSPDLKKIEKSALRRSISGKMIKRYGDVIPDQWVLYTHKSLSPEGIPYAIARLEKFRHSNTCLEVKDKKHPWWALHRARDPEIFQSPKFIGLTTTKTIEIVFDEEDDLVVTDAMYVLKPKPQINSKALLGVLLSKAILFLYRVSNEGDGRVIPQIKAAKLEPLPFPNLETIDKSQLSKLVELVERQMDLMPRLRAATAESEKDTLQNAVSTTDQKIDQLVYEIYGVTDEAELRVIEEATQA